MEFHTNDTQNSDLPSKIKGQMEFQTKDTRNRDFPSRIYEQMEFQTNDTQDRDFSLQTLWPNTIPDKWHP